MATSIAHVYMHNNPIIKTLYHAINITFTEAKLFTIRCSITQATQMENINCIVVITNSLHIAQRIFDSLVHPYQIQLSIISTEFRKFFEKGCHNSIEFWKYLSCKNWTLHSIVNKETKKFDLIPIFSCKSSWDFNRKSKYNNIFNTWKILFQASDVKGSSFLNLLDGDL